MKNQKPVHGHPWVVGIIGLCVSVLLWLTYPSMQVLSSILFFAALFHIVVGVMVVLSLYMLTPERIKRVLSIRTRVQDQKLEYGLSFGWMNGYWIAGVICLMIAILLFVQFQSSLWQVLPILLLLLAVNLFAGNYIWRSSIKTDYATLPFVELFSSDNDFILDAGCGTGRTSIALSKVMKHGRIIALDKFDADYFQDGGKTLMERNLRNAGIAERVQIVKGDITHLEFNENKFDTVVSTYMMDHLGELKLPALQEIYRVLKPNERFLIVVFEPNIFTFAVANLLCLFITPRREWRNMFTQCGFSLLEEGIINGGVYFLIKK